MNKVTKILCYGDSNTWGHIPGTGERFSLDIRWPGVLQKTLGVNYKIIANGLCGRTTDLDDPRPGREGKNGKKTLLPALQSNNPLDFVILVLGTNDLKELFDRTPEAVFKAVKGLINIIQKNSDAKIILVSPPHVEEKFHDKYKGATDKSKKLADGYLALAQKFNCIFLDAAKIVKPSPKDGIHLEASDHIKLAGVFAKILSDE